MLQGTLIRFPAWRARPSAEAIRPPAPQGHVPARDRPRRILMTLDAVGGVWRYAVDLAGALNRRGVRVILVGLGPEPLDGQIAEVEAMADTELAWLDLPLDWMAGSVEEVGPVAARIGDIARAHDVDLVHLDLPSQAVGLDVHCPIVVASHSCVVTWWAAVRGGRVPDAWTWQEIANRRGFDLADLVLAPSRSHAAALVKAYGPIDRLHVVPNAADPGPQPAAKQCFALSAGRWWDEGKNGRVLDEAAALADTPVLMAGALRGPNGETAVFSHAETTGEMASYALRALMARAAVFAAPSLYEPFGLAVLEAALAECALVVSEIPTFAEFWDGAALFADPRDPADFARMIDRFAADQGLAREYGQRARRRARKFTLDRQADAVLAAYARVLRTAGAPLSVGG
ncbi:glycosyltransferase family 4 protein [Prosthecomicrobium sp. N25]|uniref:glycosyltransferase family 4 protein n=1 Tax=Prosthecomicrobium sp. N25 TaxID=3129254 RepID=UPI0030781738